MKLANISLSALALVLAASAAPAFSADVSVQAEVIGSQARLDSGKTTVKGDVAGETEIEDGGKAETIGAAGVGVNLQYKLNDALRLGGELSWANYDGGEEKGEYSDTAVGVYTSYDFFKQDAFALYGLGGLSYHSVDPKDQEFDGIKVKSDAANLLNYDLGIGARFEVAQNVNLGLAYRFSDTLSKGEAKSTAAVAGVDVAEAKTKDISLQKNDFIASVGYSF